MANDILIQQVRELKSLKLMAKELADEIAKLEMKLSILVDTFFTRNLFYATA